MSKLGVLSVILLTLVAYGFGRWSAPETVKEVVKTVEVEKKTETKTTDTDKDKHKKTTVTETIGADGTKTTTTVIEEATTTKRTTADTSTDTKDSTTVSDKETTYSSAKVSVLALYGVRFSAGEQVWGASVSKPILGPITVGIWALTPGVIGASVGLTF